MDKPHVHMERADRDSADGKLLTVLESLEWKEKVKPNSKVVVKPNGCHVKYLPGLVTTPSLLGKLVEILKTRAGEVVVVESDLQRFSADQVFDGVGYREVVEKAGGRLSNLSEERQIKSEIPGGQYWKEREMPESLVDNDLFITVPVIKTHKLWKTSLSIKNQFGNVPESDRVKYQKHLPEVVGDFNAFDPAGLTIVDGLVGLEGDGPIAGVPKRTDLIVGGDNVVATDSVLTSVMGFDVGECELVMNAHQRGLGPVDMKRINLTGLPIEQARKPFMPPSTDFISRTERWVRKHPRLANFIYRSPFFNVAKKTAWSVRGLYGYKSKYHRQVEQSGLWKDYDWENLMQVYTPIA